MWLESDIYDSNTNINPSRHWVTLSLPLTFMEFKFRFYTQIKPELISAMV